MKKQNLYPIRYVVTHTGLTPHQIRMWERRYNAVSPQRTASNQRLYCGADVKHLQVLKKAVECGHSISRVANLPTEELIRLINRDQNDAASISQKTELTLHRACDYCDMSLDAVKDLDATRLEVVLDEASVHLTRIDFLTGVIEPLFGHIGELWRDGKLKIINEHMATTIVRSILWDVVRSTVSPEDAPRILVATPAGDPYEIGALCIATVAAEAGWQPLYFGPNLPAEEIAAAAAHTAAQAVALSVTKSPDTHLVKRELRKLHRYLGGNTAIFIGGQHASACSNFLDEIGLILVKGIDDFRSNLESLKFY